MRYYGYDKDELDGVLRGLSRRMLAVLVTMRDTGDYCRINGLHDPKPYWRHQPFDEPTLGRTLDALERRDLIVWTYTRPFPAMKTLLSNLGKAVLNRWKAAQR